MTENRWLLATQPQTTEEKQVVLKLQNEIGITEELALLLWQRGVHSFEEAKSFFTPKLEDLHDPFLMQDMEKAVERLEKAIREEETVVIYGDYDVDGTTAVALVYGFLSKYHDNIHHYNPDRYKEGYGISKTGIDWAKEKKTSLIVALDCGIKSVENIAYANTLGMDFIVCDHHEPGENLPDAVAILDPKRKGCPYPFKELTGNGVGFKLLTAFCLKRNIPLENLYTYLDLAVISIASDIVPIIGENRTLAHFGLKKLNENPSTGLKALKEVSGFQGEMNIENVVFTLGPRINAAGRIAHAQSAVDLLLSKNYEEAVDFAYKIQAHNTERKTHDSQITEEALAMISTDPWMLHEAKSTVLFKHDWHKGVIGIVASRCIEHFYRPTVIFTATKDNLAAGSARSVQNFDLYQAIDACSNWLEQFGGHRHAAGMTIKIEHIEAFRKAFDEVVQAQLQEEHLQPTIVIDLELSFSSISAKFFRIMKRMGPFGPKNMRPVFKTSGLSLASTPRIMKEKHLRLELVDPQTGQTFTAVGFGMRDKHYESLLAADQFSVVYTIEENTFRGISSLQLFLKDIKY
ncbi:single-stranded-DNA-specific exonuclease RecJ [Marinilongibacter aquaticus]|uniref:single-stranded-DNA-specific exonuclease RecJ n=1 Tax=Marinilongibacter aquaticus TaxID=2975157 RepID=UPI0021BD6624|nr:single-stranded-DNA-specific exonuclease RecJ [Marinilongibacter aquaticus]UBM57948.1 single-stranded-DNA-specific exonuclease RecJ [Marinilongibacter aquaticus]